MRLFIGFEPGDGARKELAAFQDRLRAAAQGGNYVPPVNFHVTLRFLGENDRLGELAMAMREGVRGIRPFSLALDCYGSFERGGSRIGFMSCKGDLRELRCLHESLEAALGDAGFGREARPLKPHITLARELVHDAQTGYELRQHPCKSCFSVSNIRLYESVRERGKLLYRPLHIQSL